MVIPSLAMLCVASIYFLPSILAMCFGVPHRRQIFVLNVLGGWSIVGWVASLLWFAVDVTK